jgi:rieske iron-sulfur protein
VTSVSLLVSRRKLLLATAGTGMGLAAASLLTAASGLVPKAERTPADRPPTEGDLLVFALGRQQRQVIHSEDVPFGSAPTLAWPMDSETGTVKNANLQNLILLVRAKEQDWFVPGQQRFTAQLVAAYSATCTHLCCTVSSWDSRASPHGYLLCPCHKSEFDPWDEARVVSGPAPRALPLLPLRPGPGGEIILAGGFFERVGCMA